MGEVFAGGRLDRVSSRILVVDDEPANVRILERVLGGAGYGNVVAASSGVEGVRIAASEPFDLILLDLKMPDLDGFEFLERIASRLTESYLPVIVLTGDDSLDARRRALTAGAKDFVLKPFDAAEVVARVTNLLETRSLHLELVRRNDDLERTVRERTSSLEEALGRLEASQEDLRLSRAETIDRLALAAEFRDIETSRHVMRMGSYCSLIAEQLGWTSDRRETLRLASMMHDIGKIGIPDRILRKRGPLLPDERQIMEQHAEIGHRILSGSRSEVLTAAASIAWTHHERYDGSGYPRRLKGHEIPTEGRIAAVADVFDALTTDRAYRDALEIDDALALLERGRGNHFDPAILDAFLEASDRAAVIRGDASLTARR